MIGMILDNVESRFAVFLPVLGSFVKVTAANLRQLQDCELDAMPASLGTSINGESERYKVQKGWYEEPQGAKGPDKHDELLFEVQESALEGTAQVMKQVMESATLPALQLSIPLTVDVGHGSSWDDAH